MAGSRPVHDVISTFIFRIPLAAAEMEHWCRVPEIDHLPFNVQKEIAIPKEMEDGEEVYLSCSYYLRNYSNANLDDWERYSTISHQQENKGICVCLNRVYSLITN